MLILQIRSQIVPSNVLFLPSTCFPPSIATFLIRPPAVSPQVCDSILNLSPCGQMAMGQPAFLSEEFSLDDPDIELVTTSGHGKNGALSVLQRSVRPQVGAPSMGTPGRGGGGVYWLVQSWVYLFCWWWNVSVLLDSFVRWFARQLLRWLVCLFVYSFVCLFVRVRLLVHSFHPPIVFSIFHSL